MRRWARPVLIVALLVAGVAGTRALGLGDLIRLENVARLKQWIEGFGALAPVVFIAGYVLAVVFFVPGLPITVLGGVAFGPVWGTLYVWIAATIGAALAFLVARYAVRSTVERWVRASPRLSRLDELAAEHGWRIVMLTRLVPLFPFNLQNYAYGLTRIGFWPYAVTSSICMLPGTDGSVRCVAEGPRPALEALLATLETGPAGALIDRVATQWGPASGELHKLEVRSGGHRGD